MDSSARTQVPVAGERWLELTLQANAQHAARNYRGALRLYNAALGEAESVLGRELGQPDCAESVLGREPRQPDSAESVLGREPRQPDCAESVLGRELHQPDSAESVLGRKPRQPDSAESVLGRELRQPGSRRIIGPLLLTISAHNLAQVARVQGRRTRASRHLVVAYERLIGLGLAPEVPLCVRASAARSLRPALEELLADLGLAHHEAWASQLITRARTALRAVEQAEQACAH